MVLKYISPFCHKKHIKRAVDILAIYQRLQTVSIWKCTVILKSHKETGTYQKTFDNDREQRLTRQRKTSHWFIWEKDLTAKAST